MERDKTELFQIAEKFQVEGVKKSVVPHGSGHINDTFLLTCHEGEEEKHYILQRMNHEVFKDPKGLMENVVGVTTFLQKKIRENGGDSQREALNVIPTRLGEFYYVHEDGTYWRMYLFVEDSVSYDAVERKEDFYESAVAFGHFQKLLEEYPAASLHETIPNFHNTIDRLAKFKAAVEKDICGRAEGVQDEIRFVMDRADDCHILCDMLASGEVPLRVTHNDTKLNNIMIDNQTGKGICVIDLDTVMPGSALYDYGDSIRFGANTGAEDEKDLTKISCDLELFALYTKGFTEGCEGSLTEKEIKMLPMGAKLMTLECGMRFLTDYLEGDVYFKIHRPEHNLDRCRTQFAMVKDMEDKWEKMQSIVEQYL
ncbi:MAG: aminoglycoside phosphotransferase family protein [Lachnospiraceae bacterium]|nr:aminoglycoside phosphotransferase family protein [Lachnospiraceae bacterium]